MKKANHLVNESSPYLQQHAYNPVEWYPWSNETLAKAKEEDKPILVSIGYSTCHWCHVMERESFENEEVAAYMNEHFINIKVDREERPDVDAIYMEAVQLIQNGQGGWPLNCFLLPDGRPFWGGTYFPPQPAYRRASWSNVLQHLSNAFKTKRSELEAQAAQIVHAIKSSQNQYTDNVKIETNKGAFDQEGLRQTFKSLSESFDLVNGGFGGAPKFPGTMSLRFCLNYYLSEKDSAALNHLELSLEKMALGGIYDHLGGGFARYTVDAAWLVPHFEKMLYDNALLVGLLADTYKLNKKSLYKQRVEETLVWVKREMLSDEGGFYAALDADSEGVEGKFYVWSKAEIDEVLGKSSGLFCQFYDITTHGNWEETNIVNAPLSTEDFVENNKELLKNLSDFEAFLKDCRTQLFNARAVRVRPGLDDKILLDWNALMIAAYCKAYQALGNKEYKETALMAMNFVLDKFRISQDGLHLYHSYKNGTAKHHAFLDDYAFLIDALLEIYTITQDSKYSDLASEYADLVNNEFLDFQDNLYYFTSAKQQDIILHKKTIYDNAMPSGNSMMVHNLQRLGILFDNNTYREQAQKTLLVVRENMHRYPQSFGKMANAQFLEVYPFRIMTVMGPQQMETIEELLTKTLFNTFVTTGETKAVPNLVKPENLEETNIIVCKDYTCSLAVHSTEEALKLL